MMYFIGTIIGGMLLYLLPIIVAWKRNSETGFAIFILSIIMCMVYAATQQEQYAALIYFGSWFVCNIIAFTTKKEVTKIDEIQHHDETKKITTETVVVLQDDYLSELSANIEAWLKANYLLRHSPKWQQIYNILQKAKEAKRPIEHNFFDEKLFDLSELSACFQHIKIADEMNLFEDHEQYYLNGMISDDSDLRWAKPFINKIKVNDYPESVFEFVVFIIYIYLLKNHMEFGDSMDCIDVIFCKNDIMERTWYPLATYLDYRPHILKIDNCWVVRLLTEGELGIFAIYLRVSGDNEIELIAQEHLLEAKNSNVLEQEFYKMSGKGLVNKFKKEPQFRYRKL